MNYCVHAILFVEDCLPQVGQWNMMNKVISKVRTICVLEYLSVNT
jgi:hypothetical protein